MIILRQTRIYRADLAMNPKVLYVFGDNLERKGFGGQAYEMRGEPNAFGIATKRLASHYFPDSYFFWWSRRRLGYRYGRLPETRIRN